MDLKKQIIEMTAHDLEKVEAALKENLRPNLKLVKDIASHILFSGGKRLRPLLMIHCARICGYKKGLEIDFSTIFEYLHTATLLHDDVVDKAEKRRGKNTAHTQWSVPKVILTGDFLFALACDLSVKTGIADIVAEIAYITKEMTQGEIDQLEKKGRLDLSETQYLEVIKRKTAILIQGACRSGALLAGATKEKENLLKQYGFHTGMAFQMADDLLDYMGTRESLGKNPGADMREGKLTMPLIYSLTNASAKDRLLMEKIILDPEFKPEQFEILKEKLIQYKGIEYTRQYAQQHVQKAIACVEGFGDCLSKKLLSMIPIYSVERKV
jgi:octaprenyl-diphosphate synthase